MINRIETIEDVKTFFSELEGENLNFHPDTPFEDYVNIETGVATYSAEAALLRNMLLDGCFKLCGENGIDIYELAMDVLQK